MATGPIGVVSGYATCPRLARVVTAIAARHGFDVAGSGDGASLELERPPYLPLVISRIDTGLLWIEYVREMNGDLVPSPRYGVAITSAGWAPLFTELGLPLPLFARVARWDSGARVLRVLDPGAHRELAGELEELATVLEARYAGAETRRVPEDV